MKELLLVVGISALLIKGSDTAQWVDPSPPDGGTLFACPGTSITLAWHFSLTPGDVLGDLQWLFDGSSQELVALSSHGQFVPLPAFSNRVQAEGNAGILLSNLTEGDSGNYSVEVHLYDDTGVHSVLRRSVFVQINESLMTTLHVSQSPELVKNPSTGQWAVQLQCGSFVFQDPPPMQVEWLAPSGPVASSSSYQAGTFNLLLSNPVQGGNYTCRVPPQHAAKVCLHGDVAHSGEATIFVDRLEARLSVLEHENAELRSLVTKGISHQKVGFHVFHYSTAAPTIGIRYIKTNVNYNYFNCYNTTFDTFTAPLSGLYFFLFSTHDGRAGTVSSHAMYLDNNVPHGQYQTTFLGESFSYRDDSGVPGIASIHCLVNVPAGQSVYVLSSNVEESANDQYYTASFSGFLISADP